jgi:uncharacterized lipoprotein YmbA
MKRRLPALALSVAFVLAGCGASQPTRFYSLTPLASAPQAAAPEGAGLTIGLGPVEFPKALDRPQIITRAGANELKLAEFDRWAEPVQDNALQVLQENLALLLPDYKLLAYPWNRSTEVDCQAVVRVLRFDRSEGGDAVLKARWTIQNPVSESELLNRESSYPRHPLGGDVQATVEAMNRALEDFSRDLAKALAGTCGGARR